MNKAATSQNDESKIEVSVIIPAYNAAKFLSQSIESVLRQTLKEIEIIVVDDGSTDETPLVAKSFGDKIRYFRQPNGGPASARNCGLKQANGEFIAFLDADDYFILPEKLARQLEIIKLSEDCAVVTSGWINVDTGGMQIERREPWRYTPDLSLKNLLTWHPFLSSVLFFRRSALEKVGGSNSEVLVIEDFDIVARVILAGFTANWLPEVTAAYRLHENNNSGNLQKIEADTEKYLAEFFARSDLPAEVKDIERKFRMSIRIRMGFRYFEAREFVEMKRCLIASLEYADFTNRGALPYWLNSFRGYNSKINLPELVETFKEQKLFSLPSDCFEINE